MQGWQDICRSLDIQWTWSKTTLHDCFALWVNKHMLHAALPLFICWGVWLHRNRCLFEDSEINPFYTGLKILASYKEYWTIQKGKKCRQITSLNCDYTLVGFFDGAAVDGHGGCGFTLYISRDHRFQGWMGIKSCTNNMAELTAAWSLLFWAHTLHIKELKIYGDSLLVIDWLLGKHMINAYHLTHWCHRILELSKQFDQLHFEHIYRAHNMEADSLSKKGIGYPEGTLQIEEFLDGNIINCVSHRIY